MRTSDSFFCIYVWFNLGGMWTGQLTEGAVRRSTPADTRPCLVQLQLFPFPLFLKTRPTAFYIMETFSSRSCVLPRIGTAGLPTVSGVGRFKRFGWVYLCVLNLGVCDTHTPSLTGGRGPQSSAPFISGSFFPTETFRNLTRRCSGGDIPLLFTVLGFFAYFFVVYGNLCKLSFLYAFRGGVENHSSAVIFSS